jgi:hypothetical protein
MSETGVRRYAEVERNAKKIPPCLKAIEGFK